ncbi:YlxR family protein [Crassaminicella thermophila]|uniref:YlxR family protein n=1 Tax=Crassaminicella thermophila TaxID=2599308 RepID=A0A5C0SCD3_CRATE|nr:YlxR family protein [Crassaminicella thermophila]QEK12233.1 YlxR family protein [Crassaminicella thermophila]
MKKRKIPLRQCIGCMSQKPKKELIRIVKSKDGEIKLDMTGKAHGRGAYICNDVECFKKMHKKKALNKAFQQEVNEEIYNQLQEELIKNE